LHTTGRPCHNPIRVAERDPPEPHDRAVAIERLYSDIARAKQLAFDKESDNGTPMPDLAALPKLLELEAKIYGLLSADGKARSGDTVSVPLEEAEKLVKAARVRLKESKT
jgi:hypothetical protein